jgi:hypothetical protein
VRDGIDSDQVAALLDRTAAVDVTNRLCRCVDQRDWAALAECFRTEVTVRYEYVLGPGRATLTASTFIDRWRAAVGSLETTQHFLTNQCVKLREDRATVTAYCLIHHTHPAPSGDRTWTLGGHLEFELVRTGGDWRIDTLVLSTLWTRGNRYLLERADGTVRRPTTLARDRTREG